MDCVPSESEGERVISGCLVCTACKAAYPIRRSIPRFVDDGDYAASFGYQWTRFRLEQIDSEGGHHLSERRFFTETTWTTDWLKEKWILDAGCGAGRFLEIASRGPCDVVGLDLSCAVDAALQTLADRPRVHLVQASLFALPFRTGSFDGCYCLGVLQHTPDPRKAMEALPRILKTGGRIALTAYERKPWTCLNAKYLVRPLTRRLGHRFLLGAIKAVMPIAFPLTELLFRLPLLGRLFRFVIPIANHVHEEGLSCGKRYQWAIMDTFDMLSPEFDQPQTQPAVIETLSQAGIVKIERLKNPGLNVVGVRGPS